MTSTTKPDGTVFTFDEDGRAEKETYANGLVRDLTYTSNQTVIAGSHGITATYNLNGFGKVTEYKLQNGENNKNYSYTYDSDGNITSISLDGSLQQTFTYNSSNELIRVDDVVANKTITYAYDYVGNITAVTTFIYTTGTLGTPLTTQNYTYNSQNQRTDLSYDANGNLTSLNGFDFSWDGRRLSSAVSADTNIAYTYNHNGIRTSKMIGGTTITYTVDENNNVIEQTDGANTMKFVYDSSNSPIYMEYNGVTYYYEKNLQGDIVAILDADGNTVVEYSYDIWGKLLGITGELASTLGIANPLRYRGYYYDTETELYYLQSRYYSPDLMRFISQDDPVLSNAQGQPLGSNLYAYCLNAPVMFLDSTGNMSVSFLRMMSQIYNANIINSSVASLATIALNGLGIYTAFHEIAQLNIAKELKKRGYKVTLEYRVGKKGEADIVAQANWYSKKYVWEVKPLGTSASAQLSKYTKGTGLLRGFSLGSISNIPIIGKIKMNITFDSSGGAYYAFYLKGNRVTNAEFYRALSYSIKAATAVATAIIVATVAEDIVTAGVGIWNDMLSFGGATGAMIPILNVGLRLCKLT